MSNKPVWHDWSCLYTHQEDQPSLLRKKEFFKSSNDFATNPIYYSTSVNPAEMDSWAQRTCFCEENVTSHIGVISHQRRKQLTLCDKRYTKADMTWAEQSCQLIFHVGEWCSPLSSWRAAHCFAQRSRGGFVWTVSHPQSQLNQDQKENQLP